MAGLWIRIEHVTPDKPEVHRIAAELNIDADMVLGKLIRLWVWADQQAISGCARSATKALLDRVTLFAGFADALISVGWLIETEDGVEFPNFERLNGEGAKRRGLASNRMAKSRVKLNENVTQPAQQKANKSATREEEIREEKSKYKEPPLPPTGGSASPRVVKIPPELNTVEFREAWTNWTDHRKEIKKPLKPTQAVGQMNQFLKWGLDRSIAAIEYTIRQGWQGLKEPPDDESGTGTTQNRGLSTRTIPTGAQGGRERDRQQRSLDAIAEFAASEGHDPQAVMRLGRVCEGDDSTRRLEADDGVHGAAGEGVAQRPMLLPDRGHQQSRDSPLPD